MRKSDTIAAAVLLVLGILAIFVIIPHQTTPGERYGLPPAFFPTLSMALITGLSAVLLLKNILKSKKKDADDPVPMTHRNWIYIFGSIIFLFICLAIINYVGFIVGGIIIIASFMIYMGERKILTIVLLAGLAPVLIYLILWKFLQVMLV